MPRVHVGDHCPPHTTEVVVECILVWKIEPVGRVYDYHCEVGI